MNESNELYSEIINIRQRLGALENIQSFALSVNEELKKKYEDKFRRDQILFKIYKSIDGKRTQTEIAKLVDVNDMTVSRKISALKNLGLIELSRTKNNSKIYRHSLLEKIFRFTDFK